MEHKGLSLTELNKIGSRELGYLGDSVYEVNIRRRLILSGLRDVKTLNRQSENYVSARSQAEIFDAIYDELDDEEKAVARRGRNSKVKHPSKSVDIHTYRKATALECVFGYLSVTDRRDRIEKLSDMIFLMRKTK